MNGSKPLQPNDQPEPVERLEQEIQRLEAENESLKRKIKDLEEELRASKRQAAPFSKGQRKANPQPPGRRAGQGTFRYRPAPAEPSVGEIVEATAPAGCPSCGGALTEEGEEWATTTDLPVQPQPQITRYRVSVCRCRQCGKRVRGTAPGLAANQFGATAHRVGPGVKAAAHALHYGAGVPVRKLPMVLKELTGITLTQGAMTQDALRRGEAEVGARYRQLCGGMREASVINTDDTGWRVGGSAAYLMVFVSAHSTVYQIRGRHRNQEVREVIPADYAGVMGTDRGKSYDAGEFDAVEQQKCLGHLQRNLTEVLEAKKGRAREFALGLKDILRQSMELHRRRSHLLGADYQLQVQQMDEALTFHLRDRFLKDDDNQRLLDGIGLQQDRGNLLRFLRVEGLEPTNNRAERALRPAVIARKVSHCSKNQRGAEAFAAFVSVIQTATQAGAPSTIAYLRNLFSTPASSSG
jgi:transposase